MDGLSISCVELFSSVTMISAKCSRDDIFTNIRLSKFTGWGCHKDVVHFSFWVLHLAAFERNPSLFLVGAFASTRAKSLRSRVLRSSFKVGGGGPIRPLSWGTIQRVATGKDKIFGKY